MEAATNLGLPWRLLREKLAPAHADSPATDVHYNLTLEMLDTDLIVSTISFPCYFWFSFFFFSFSVNNSKIYFYYPLFIKFTIVKQRTIQLNRTQAYNL